MGKIRFCFPLSSIYLLVDLRQIITVDLILQNISQISASDFSIKTLWTFLCFWVNWLWLSACWRFRNHVIARMGENDIVMGNNLSCVGTNTSFSLASYVWVCVCVFSMPATTEARKTFVTQFPSLDLAAFKAYYLTSVLVLLCMILHSFPVPSTKPSLRDPGTTVRQQGDMHGNS